MGVDASGLPARCAGIGLPDGKTGRICHVPAAGTGHAAAPSGFCATHRHCGQDAARFSGIPGRGGRGERDAQPLRMRAAKARKRASSDFIFRPPLAASRAGPLPISIPRVTASRPDRFPCEERPRPRSNLGLRREGRKFDGRSPRPRRGPAHGTSSRKLAQSAPGLSSRQASWASRTAAAGSPCPSHDS